MSHVETTNKHVRPWDGDSDGCVWQSRARPLETEADLIAAAVPPGLVTTRRMFDLIEDVADHSWCALCGLDNQSAATFESWYKSWQQSNQEELNYFGVEWDPTITF